MSQRRKLTAILSADVAGYSRLMSDDERATLHTLTTYRQIISVRVAQHEGRIVDSPGDAVLAEFPSAVEAVQCAMELQQELARRNAQLAEHRRMHFRIGINLGDVIEEAGALYGDGVNVAARLEALAQPGSLCISGTVFDQVEGKLPFRFKYLGEQEVKNIPKPVRAYRSEGLVPVVAHTKRRRWLLVGLGLTATIALVAFAAVTVMWQRHTPTGARVPPEQDPAIAVPKGPAIAVLALQNMSGDPKQDYFADGISEEIIASLSRFTALRVLARNSTFQYKGRSVDVRQIGREIGADYVVEGSVRKSGSTVRVTAQLLDASTGAHIWAETYERNLTADNLFAVQDQITDQVVSRIGDVHGAVNRSQVQQLRTKSAASLADYECLLLAYEYQRFLTPDKHATVKECLARTVERNPNYAEAWANLAYIYTDQYWAEYSGPPNPLERAYDAARRAVQLDPASQIAHYTLANVYFFRNDLDGFLVEAEKALALNPNNTEILAGLGIRFTCSERRERGIALIQKARALNPAHPGWYWAPISFDHYRNKDYQAALQAARRIDMPGFWYTHLWLAAPYGALGDTAAGRAALDDLDAINPAFKRDPLKYLGLLEIEWVILRHFRAQAAYT